MKALCDVELNMNSQFSIRRLKAVIHQNGSGEAGTCYVCVGTGLPTLVHIYIHTYIHT